MLKSLTPLTVMAGCDTPPPSVNYQPNQSIANGAPFPDLNGDGVIDGSEFPSD